MKAEARFLQRLSSWHVWDLVWAIFVFLLPLTSVPLIVQLVHSDVVAAPSALLLLPLCLGWLLPRLALGTPIPDSSRPLILFVCAALLSTLVSFFYDIPYYKDLNTLPPTLSGVLTLMIGFCFYLIAAIWNQDRQKLRRTFQLIDLAGTLVLVWTLMQAFAWYTTHGYPNWMKSIQYSLSVGSLYRQRFVGFTLEPSWLAHQLNLLFLPFWFAASVSSYSAFPRRGWLSLERVLFAVGVLVLFLTLSRVGLAAFLLTALFFILCMVHKRITFSMRQVTRPARRRLIRLAAFFGILLAMFAFVLALGWVLSKLDFRMANLFHIQWRGRSDPVLYLAEKLSLAARFVYWDAGLGVFNDFPLLGVGLGHAGFYLPDQLNDYALRLVEVCDLLFRSQTLLNIKSLWIRILAETGIVGFSFFLLWYLQSIIQALHALSQTDPLLRTIGWMGCFTLIAFLLEGFSLDTFALPYLWFSIGIVNTLPLSGSAEASA